MAFFKSACFSWYILAVSMRLFAKSPVDAAARHCLSDFETAKFHHLKMDALNDSNYELKLFASYLLYKKNKNAHLVTFINAIPANRNQFESFSQIAYKLVLAPGAETYEVKNPSVPWPISFWQIYQSIFDLAVEGKPKAIKAIFGLSGFGDGEVGEVLGESWRLFYHPCLVAAHWSLFESHIDGLGAVRSESNEAEIQELKSKYMKAFANNQNALKAILWQLEHGVR